MVEYVSIVTSWRSSWVLSSCDTPLPSTVSCQYAELSRRLDDMPVAFTPAAGRLYGVARWGNGVSALHVPRDFCHQSSLPQELNQHVHHDFYHQSSLPKKLTRHVHQDFYHQKFTIARTHSTRTSRLLLPKIITTRTHSTCTSRLLLPKFITARTHSTCTPRLCIKYCRSTGKVKTNSTLGLNEVQIKFEFYKRSSNLEKKLI